MVKRGPAIECEMILAFLKAEADSPRFADHFLPLVSQVLRHATTAGARGSISADGQWSRRHSLRRREDGVVKTVPRKASLRSFALSR